MGKKQAAKAFDRIPGLGKLRSPNEWLSGAIVALHWADRDIAAISAATGCPAKHIEGVIRKWKATLPGKEIVAAAKSKKEPAPNVTLGELACREAGLAVTAKAKGTVPVSVAIENIEIEFRKALPHLLFSRQLEEQWGEEPQISTIEIDVASCIKGTFFKDMFVVWAVADVTFVNPRNAKEKQEVTFHSMHFVNGEAHLPEVGSKGSYELQSVAIPDKPFEMQCVAGIMTQFGILIQVLHRCTTLITAMDKDPVAQLDLSMASVMDGRVVVLGMGGNIVADCLAVALPSAKISIVEVEPAVKKSCVRNGGFPPRSGVEAIIGDVGAAVPNLPSECALMFLDCFDPITGSMLTAKKLLNDCKRKLAIGGVLVVNTHCSPSPSAMTQFVEVFGCGNVHVTNIRGCKQCMVACIKVRGGKSATGRQSSASTKATKRSLDTLISHMNASPDLLQGLRIDQDLVDSSCTIDTPAGSCKHWKAL